MTNHNEHKKTTNKNQSVTKYVADGKRGKKRAKLTIASDWIAYSKNKSKINRGYVV